MSLSPKQKQQFLYFFGCLEEYQIDGIWGKQSKEATIKLQRKLGIKDDGLFGAGTEDACFEALLSGESLPDIEGVIIIPPTGDFWDEIKYFTREEFRCQCKGKYCNGFPVEPQEKMVRTVDEIRRRLGVPVTIVESGGSGVRCPVHNANVGGVANSNHLTGNAADLHSGKSPEEMARVAEEVMGNTGEIGIYDWGIHVGVNCKYSRFYG